MLRNALKTAALSALLLQQTARALCGCNLRVESFVNQGLSFDVVSSLIIGLRAAVVVDLPLAVAEAEKLARWAKNMTDKPLVAAFTTHSHPDHYLSGKSFLEHFPEAKHYATPESWLATLDFLGGLRPLLVVPGHALTVDGFDVEHTRRYVSCFHESIEAKGADFYTPREIADLLERKFPGLTNMTSSNSSAILLNITAEKFGRGGKRMVHYFDLTAYNDTKVLDG